MENVTHQSSNYQLGNANCSGTTSTSNNNNSNDISNNSSRISCLSDVRDFLQPAIAAINLQADAASYDHIVEMIRGLDLQDDGIEMNRKVKGIEMDFCNIVLNEDVLCESMEYMNNKALEDSDTSLKFAMLFSSRNFDALAMNETKVRSTMLKILETNFINAEIYRTTDKNRFYNSITMLGEYYHRVRLADNSPLTILGESLLNLLQMEISGSQSVDVRLAKLILSQITLNGRLLHVRHQTQLSQLFYYIRCQLIEQPSLTATIKALLLMTLDMYYSNFLNLNKQLEDMYTKYFLQGEQELEAEAQQSEMLPNNEHQLKSPVATNGIESSCENGQHSEVVTSPLPTTTKKWSEQVCEDSYENAFGDIDEISWNDNYANSEDLNNSLESKHEEAVNNNDKQRKSQESDVVENKPIPRWRATRFNRETNATQNDKHQVTGRRLSGNFDDDQHSVRSEGGSIRLYSISDRLKYSQEKIERVYAPNSSNNRQQQQQQQQQQYYNASTIANSNWDKQSQRDDRSERSYMSNYERGNQQHRRHGGSRHFNNNQNNNHKQTYDKPPRFQKQQQLQQQQQQKTAPTDTWRRRWSRGNSSPKDTYNNAYAEDDVDSCNSMHARTLPRPHKGSFDKEQSEPRVASTSYRRRSSQSPHKFGQARNYRDRHMNNNSSHNYHNNNNSHHHHYNNSNNNNQHRYGSQNSLASDTSSVFAQRQKTRQYQNTERQMHANSNKNNRNFKQQNHKGNNINGLNEEKDWSTEKNVSNADVDGEIVRNARQTVNYMNYLSQK